MRLGFCGLIGAIGLAGCSPIREEVNRWPSPEDTVDAVVVRTNTHATVSFSYAVFLEPVSADGRRVRVADYFGGTGVDVWWIDADTLAIDRKDAREGRIVRSRATVGGRTIEVRDGSAAAR